MVFCHASGYCACYRPFVEPLVLIDLCDAEVTASAAEAADMGSSRPTAVIRAREEEEEESSAPSGTNSLMQEDKTSTSSCPPPPKRRRSSRVLDFLESEAEKEEEQGH